MFKPIPWPVLILLISLVACNPATDGPPHEAMESAPTISQDEFEHLLNRLAESWNAGDARRAVECFAEDAVYVEPPDKQKYEGRLALYEFFGGDSGRPGQMSMTWHHVVFNPATQVGAGEFTFTYGSTVHGVALIKVRHGRISRWREYWYESDLDWPDFVGDSAFHDDAG